MEEGNQSQLVRVVENDHLKYGREVEYSRFFNFQKSSLSSTNLKILPKHRFLCGGTWLSSALLASVNLTHAAHDVLVLVLGFLFMFDFSAIWV